MYESQWFPPTKFIWIHYKFPFNNVWLPRIQFTTFIYKNFIFNTRLRSILALDTSWKSTIKSQKLDSTELPAQTMKTKTKPESFDVFCVFILHKIPPELKNEKKKCFLQLTSVHLPHRSLRINTAEASKLPKKEEQIKEKRPNKHSNRTSIMINLWQHVTPCL